MKSFKQFLMEMEAPQTPPPEQFEQPEPLAPEEESAPIERGGRYPYWDTDFLIDLMRWLEKWFRSRNPREIDNKELHHYLRYIRKLQERNKWSDERTMEEVKKFYVPLPMEDHPDFVGPPSSLAEE